MNIQKTHPYYQIMDLSKTDLEKELKGWNRQEIISWLSWNDANGVYNDEDSLNEMGNILSKKEGIEIMIRQIIQDD